MMNEEKNYYEILGVSHDASSENIRKACDRLKFVERVPFDEWKIIDKAFDVLYHSDSRKAYDEELKQKEESRFFVSGTDDIGVEEKEETSIVEPQVEPETLIEKPVEETKTKEEVVEQQEQDEEKQVQPQEEIKEEQKEPQPVVNTPPIPTFAEPIIGTTTYQKKSLKNQIFDGLGQKERKFVMGSLIATGACFTLIGPLGIVAGVIPAAYLGFKKLKDKFRKMKLTYKSYTGDITAIGTLESEEIKRYNDITAKQIYKLLKEKNNLTEIKILQKRFENSIKLLRKQIEFKKMIRCSKEGYASVRLAIASLTMQLQNSIRTLDYINAQIALYENSQQMKKVSTSIEKLNTHPDVSKVVSDRYEEHLPLELSGLQEENQESIGRAR